MKKITLLPTGSSGAGTGIGRSSGNGYTTTATSTSFGKVSNILSRSISRRQLLRNGAFLAAGLPFAGNFLDKIQAGPIVPCPVIPLVHPAAGIVLGVNVTGVQDMSEAQQDALIGQMQQNGVKTVRTGISEKFTRFIIRAYERGIGSVVIIYPTEASTGGQVRPADKSVGLQWAQPPITAADPVKFKAWLASRIETLEAAGVHLTAFELGNEINGPFFNGDFLPAQASGRVLGIGDLNNPDDPEGRAIAASYRAYLKIMAVLKELRDHSTLNQTTPIISAGLADGGLPGKKPGQRLDGVSIPATLAFLRQNGLDELVDGYGVHVYPSNDPHRWTVPGLIDDLNKDALALCTASKPAWLTEWGFDNKDNSCPLDDSTRVKLIETMRNALQHFAGQGRLAASIYYSWGSHPGETGSTIFRCGDLTEAGKLALKPM